MIGALALLAFADVDSSYGRIDGPVALATSAGVGLGPRIIADARVRYMQTAGVFATAEGGPDAAPRSLVALGVEARPLFIARWATGRELGRPRLDLALDSFALELGVAFQHPGGEALQAGVGVEVPFFADATGPFLGVRAGGRWSNAALAGASDGALYLGLTLGWQQVFRGGGLEAAP